MSARLTRFPRFRAVLVAASLSVTLLAGCHKPIATKPDYNHQLGPGESALRLILDPKLWPDVREGFNNKDTNLTDALDRSIAWFARPSSKQFFPLGDVTHVRAQTSAYAFKKLMEQSSTADDFEKSLRDEFHCYTSVGFDERGSVLFTGYYSPIFKGSKTPTAQFSYPLYKKPADLAIDPVTGVVLGRKTATGYTPYPSRSELETTGVLKGLELVYVGSRFDQYVIQVNGSAKIELTDGSTMFIGYSGNNGHEYTGLGATLIKEGAVPADKLSLAAIREYFQGKEEQLDKYIARNERYVFFTGYDGNLWPAGSLNVKVSPFRTLATDKTIFPRGGVIMAVASIPTGHGSPATKPGAPLPAEVIPGEQREMADPALANFKQFMLDQDTGGAIRAAGRSDIYMGIGGEAEHLAGAQFSEGRLYYFFLKHDRVLDWNQKMINDPAMQPKKTAKIAAAY